MNFLLRLKHWQLFLLFALSVMLQTISHEIGFIFTFAILLGWTYSISIGINNLLPPNLKHKTGFFEFNIGYAFIYIGLSRYLLQQEALLEIIIPFHIYAYYAIFYSFFFAARQIRTFQNMRPTAFGECLSLIFLFWCSPIGLWFIQPQVNSIQEHCCPVNFQNKVRWL